MSLYKPGRPTKYTPAAGTAHRPPAKPGEYRIRSASGSMLYIGQTNDLARRTREHLRTGKLTPDRTLEYKVADGRYGCDALRAHERQKIAQHRPPLNKTKGGEGRPPK